MEIELEKNEQSVEQRPDSVEQRPDSVEQRPDSVEQRPDFRPVKQYLSDVSGHSERASCAAWGGTTHTLTNLKNNYSRDTPTPAR